MKYEAPEVEILYINAHEDVVCNMSNGQQGTGQEVETDGWWPK